MKELPMTPLHMLGSATAIVFAVIAVWHYYWALGGPIGIGLALPQRADGSRVFSPSRQATLIAAAAFSAVSVLLAAEGGWFATPVQQQYLRAAIVAVAVILVLRAVGDFHYVGAFKRVRRTRFARYDSWFYSPLSLALGLALALVAR